MSISFRRWCLVMVLLCCAAGGAAQEADLLVTKSSPGESPAGSDVSFDVTLTNLGPDAAAAVQLLDPIPAGMTFVSATQNNGPSFNCNLNGGTIDCTLASMAAGETAAFTFVMQIDALTSPGTFFTNIASASSQTADPNPENDSGIGAAWTPFPTQADLVVAKSAPPGTAPDTDLVFTITLTNAGPDAAQNVVLDDVLPGGLIFVSLAQSGTPLSCTIGGTVSCTAASYPSNASTTLTLTTHVPAGSPSGTGYNNTATVESDHDGVEENNSASTNTTVAAVDLSVTKVGPGNVTAGNTITYDLTITNTGPDLAGAVLTDDLPAGTTFSSLTQNSGPDASCSTPLAGTAGIVLCEVFLGFDQSVNFTLVVNATGSTASVTNTAVASSPDQYETDPSDNSASVVTSVTPVADLSVVKTGPLSVTAGTDVTYTVAVSNDGPSAASTVQLTDTLPANTTLVSFGQTSGELFSCTAPAVGGTGTIDCSIAALPASSTATFTLVVHLAPTATGSLANTATITSPTSDPDAGDRTSTASAPITVSADLSVVKVGPVSATAGTDVTYTIDVSNSGPSTASTVQWTDALPANTTLVSFGQTSGTLFTCTAPAAGGTGTIDCSIATLAPSTTAAFTLVVHLAPSATGSLSNTATVTSPTSDPDAADRTSNTIAPVTLSADLAVTKSGPAAAPAGTDATYTVTVLNNGPSDAAAVTLTDAVPAGTTFVSATQTSGPLFNCTAPAPGATGTIDCSIATLAPSATATFNLVFAIAPTASGTVDNTATVASTTSDPLAGSNTATASTGINPGTTDLAITKTAGAATFGFGSPVTYTIVVTNNGPATAFGTTVTDTLPAGTTFQSVATTQGSCTGTTTVVCTVGTLAPLASATITLTVLLPTTPGTVSNTASVSAANAESNAGNNSSTAALAVTSEIPSLSAYGLALLAIALAVVAMKVRMQV